MGQITGAFLGFITAFIACFLILLFGTFVPEDVVASSIVDDFVGHPDLELKLAIVGTVLYPPHLGQMLPYGAQQSTVLMALVWGLGGLLAGLVSRDIVKGVFAAIFAVVIGAVLTWLMVFIVQTADIAAIFGSLSLLILQVTFEGTLYPLIAAVIGGLLGSAITRER